MDTKNSAQSIDIEIDSCQCTVAKASKNLESDRYLTQVMCESENYCDGEIENLFK